MRVQLLLHESSNPGSLHLEKVFIKKSESANDPTGRMWLVDVAAWLCTSHLRKQDSLSPALSCSLSLSRSLSRAFSRLPKEAYGAADLIELPVMSAQQVKSYRIDIFTGLQRRGGTNGHVLLDINGANFSTVLHMPWKKSATHYKPFCRGQHDVFLLDGKSNHNLPDLGDLRSLTLSLTEPKRFCWFLERVDFHDLSNGGLVRAVDRRILLL